MEGMGLWLSLNTIRLNVFGNRWDGTEVIKLEERSTCKKNTIKITNSYVDTIIQMQIQTQEVEWDTLKEVHKVIHIGFRIVTF